MKQFFFSTVCIFLIIHSVSAQQGYKSFHIGNSLTDETYGMNEAAVSLGHEGVEWGRYMIPGAPIHLLWRDRNSGGLRRGLGPVTEPDWGTEDIVGSIDNYITTADVDAIIMQIFPGNGDSFFNNWSADPYNDKTIDGIIGFSGALYAGNPDGQVFLYASHTMSSGSLDESLDDEVIGYGAMKDSIESAYPQNNPVWVIPAPLAFNMMINAGYADLWIPNNGHANNNGRYLLAMLFYCVVYKRDCAGAHSVGAVSGELKEVSAEYAAKTQEIAWAAAQAYELSGVSSTVHIIPSVRAASVVPQNTTGLLFDLTGRHYRGSAQSASVFITDGTLKQRIFSRVP